MSDRDTSLKTLDGAPLSLSEQAYRALRDRIVRLDLEPGSVLSEAALSSELGFGRTPIVEAVKRLAREGLVVILPRRATLVAEIKVDHPLQVAEVRTELEVLAARLAAERATAADHEELRELQAELSGIGPELEFEALMAIDGRVHRTVYRLAKNPLLEETLEMYYNLAARIWYSMHDRMPTSLVTELGRHTELIDAIVDGDPERAAELVRAHVQLSTSYHF